MICKFDTVIGNPIWLETGRISRICYPAHHHVYMGYQDTRYFHVAGCCDLVFGIEGEYLRVIGSPDELMDAINGKGIPTSKPTIQLKATPKGVASRVAGRKTWNQHNYYEAAIVGEALKLLRVEFVKEEEV